MEIANLQTKYNLSRVVHSSLVITKLFSEYKYIDGIPLEPS